MQGCLALGAGAEVLSVYATAQRLCELTGWDHGRAEGALVSA